MTLYFAYGSNMDVASMAARCPSARALGTATLEGHQFFIGREGWGSVRPARGHQVHGVLWNVTPRDIAILHAYELLHKGLYNVRWLPVVYQRHRVSAMIYLLRRQVIGAPKPGYAEMCAMAARSWRLPESYVRSIERWSPSRWTGARAVEAGEGA